MMYIAVFLNRCTYNTFERKENCQLLNVRKILVCHHSLSVVNFEGIIVPSVWRQTF